MSNFALRGLNRICLRSISGGSAEQRLDGNYIYNRNPRSLERLTIGRKPGGWHLEKIGRSYWHKLEIKKSSRHITADIIHHSGTIPVTCSTNEWSLRKHLYSANDTSAYINLGRVLAMRCLEAGINEISCYLERKPGSKLDKLLKQMEESGVVLSEPPVYQNPRPSDVERPEKPWIHTV